MDLSINTTKWISVLELCEGAGESDFELVMVKVKLSLCLNSSAVRHEDIWGSRGIAPPFHTSALDGGEWSASRPCRFTNGERAPGTHWIGGWVESVWTLWREKSCTAGNRTRAVQPAAHRYTDSWNLQRLICIYYCAYEDLNKWYRIWSKTVQETWVLTANYE
jgi:hypothetical protein